MKYTYGSLVVRIDQGVAYVMLSSPGNLHATAPDIKRELADFLEKAGGDDRIRIILLTGKDKIFCVGADLNIKPPYNSKNNRKSPECIHNLAGIISRLGKPVIAAVNGYAIGAGMELALVCDVIIAAANAKFYRIIIGKENEADGAGGACAVRIPEYDGQEQVGGVRYVPQRFDAREAVRHGLADKVVREEDLIKEATAVALSIMKGYTVSLTSARRIE